MAVSSRQSQRQAAARQRWMRERIMPHERGLRALLRRLGCPVGDIEEIVQDAYVRLLKLERVSHIRDPRQYLFQTARSILLTHVRRRKIVHFVPIPKAIETSLACAKALPDATVADRQMLDLLERGLAELPERTRRIFELRRLEGRTIRETAALLGINESTVDKHIAEAMAWLARACGWPLRRRVRAGK